jgi:hypothetical protein
LCAPARAPSCKTKAARVSSICKHLRLADLLTPPTLNVALRNLKTAYHTGLRPTEHIQLSHVTRSHLRLPTPLIELKLRSRHHQKSSPCPVPSHGRHGRRGWCKGSRRQLGACRRPGFRVVWDIGLVVQLAEDLCHLSLPAVPLEAVLERLTHDGVNGVDLETGAEG